MVLESSFVVPSSIGAMAKHFYVSREKFLLHLDGWYLKPGSTVTGIKEIARGDKIREVKRLIERYPLSNGTLTKPQDWIKVRGTATITNGVKEICAEIHWYQCENIGKVEFKVKNER